MICSQTCFKNDFNDESGTQKETVKASKNSASHGNIKDLQFISGLRTFLAKKKYDMSLEDVSTSTQPILAKLRKDTNQALERYVVVYRSNKNLE